MLLLLSLLACEEPTDPENVWERGENPHLQDDVLRMNHVQVKGTHNSYHLEPDNPLDDSHRYSQPTLTEQLDLYGVRQFELDLHLTEDDDWEVFHIPGIDAETTCQRFVDCLGELKTWSDAHGWHLPLVVWLEPKDDIDGMAEGYDLIRDDLPLIDDAIRSVWPEDRLFTPDDLRKDHADLPTALAADGWPLLGEVRGQVLFAILDTGEHRDTYLAGSDVLAGRVAFVDTSNADDPFAAMVKDGSPAEITAWAEAGFLITDNGSGAVDDAATAQAIDEEEMAAGVHHLATDMPAPGGDYFLDLAPRCNPVTAPQTCDDAEIEKL